MRLLTLAAVLTFLVVAGRAQAQTTTTSAPPTTSTTETTTTVTTTTGVTSTTTTTLPIAITQCIITGEQVLGDGYHTFGYLRGAGEYPTNGMGFTQTTSAKAAAWCLCKSRFRKGITVVFGSFGGYVFVYDPTSYKVLAYSSGGTELTPGSTALAQAFVPFAALCY